MNNLRTRQRFHGCLDAELVCESGRMFVTKKRSGSSQFRELSYQFYPHFHPYAGQLLQRLVRKSTADLQAADTEYNTRVKLSAAAEADSNAIQLAQGETVNLLDGAAATLPSGSLIRFVGSKVIDQRTETSVTLAANTIIVIPSKTVVRRSNGTMVTLEDDEEANLVDGMPRPIFYEDIFGVSRRSYMPEESIQGRYPVKDLDFTASGAYSGYNWELFFHAPLTIAIHLSKNQRFAEAQRWFHYMFDPTDKRDGPTPERFWKVRPFQYTDVKKIEEVLLNLATGADPNLRDETIQSIKAWKEAPFRPHVIARFRQQSFMVKTVMAYLDNLIDWGDSLFRQDTGEAIDEAMMLYVLAANILGPRPLAVPKKGSVRSQTYANLREDLDKFGNAMRDMEADVPYDLTPYPAEEAPDVERIATLRSLGKALYFCVPRNDKLLSYWDTVADRLFKIRNSLNIQGVFRQLPLFEPPLDPAMLARATAAGLDVGAIVNGLNQPLPLVRFQLLVQKATEVCQEVKSLGNNLLSAMEKEDTEMLAILRAKHERVIMEMVEHVRYAQVQDAIKSREGLLKSLVLAVQRYSYYERQLGREADEIEKAIPELEELDKDNLEKMKLAISEPDVVPRDIEVDIAQDLGSSGGRIISSHELLEIGKLASAQDDKETAQDRQLAGQAIALLPELGVDFHFWGIGGRASFGGSALGRAAQFAASVASGRAETKSYEASQAARIGSYARREQEWAFQSNLAAGEITNVFMQLRGAQIREAIAELELKNHRQQMKNADEIERFLNEEGAEKNGKTTNKSLYAWMKREVKGLYGQCFQLAFDIAKKAERALQHELGKPELSHLKFGYLAGKQGLLAGERLYLDIKRMEIAYHDLNQHEYELAKHVSLLQIDPRALLQLRTTGRCTVTLPETAFDMDGPGHYFRRIKSVALSIPCVTGPYTSVNCTLTLLKSTIRKSQNLRDGVYAREDAEDDRFDDYFGSLQSIVTSSAQNDSGLFDTNLGDERYLPFEYSGAVSEWQLELPANPSEDDPHQFDYETISDAILHLRYTAREGGQLLRKGALDSLKEGIKTAGSVRLFSVRHEFPTEWAKFQSQTSGAGERFELALDLRPEHYPFWSQGRLDGVMRVDIVARSAKTESKVFDRVNGQDAPANSDTLVKDAELGDLLVGRLMNIALPGNPVGEFKLFFDDESIKDVWIAITWSGD